MVKTCKIRGIYSTALSILFSGTSGYEITFPSREISKRLHVPSSSKPADITINDRTDLLGVVVEGKVENLAASNFPLSTDVIPGCAVIQAVPNKFAIYKGVVVGRNEKYGYNSVLLSPEENIVGILPDADLKVDTEVIVQVVEPGSKSGKKKPTLSRSITCPGSYAVLIPENKVTFSKSITDHGLRKELMAMASGHPARRDGHFGIIFRTSCCDARLDDIRADLDVLASRMAEIREKVRSAPRGLVIDPLGIGQLDVIFSKQSLDYLDGVRGQKTRTIPGHHYWRIVTTRIGNADYLLDFVENLLVQNVIDEKSIAKAFTTFTHEHFPLPQKGDIVSIMHYKPNGDMFKLKPGRVVDAFYSSGNVPGMDDLCVSLVLEREFNPQPWHTSFYDGLEGIDIKPGDHSTCYVKENFPVLTNKYFRADGTFLGCYYNISTPVQVFPGELQYLDLEIDVVENQAGERKVIDKDKLDVAVEEGYISRALADKAKDIADLIFQGKIKADLACDGTIVA
ncbi:MAG: DUF402 domain-containing protein [Candidatus Sigynarchaeota archaeon]